MNLIYDRTAADVETAKALRGKTSEPLKGCYNASDMNRVIAAVKQLAAELNAAGYAVEVGNTHTKLPAGYTELEYIQSSGTQYIDTRLLCNKSDYYEFEMEVQLTNNSAYAGANGYMQFQASITGGAKCRLKVVYQDNIEKIYVDDALKLTKDWTSDYNGENVRIGLLKLGDAGDSWYNTSNIQSGKIYFVNIKKDGIYVRKYIPAKNSSGILGLFDTVNSVFYKNSGSGTFTAGAEIETESLEWQTTDIIRLSQWRQYIANVQALRDAFYTRFATPELPAADAKLTYEGANTIERVLADIDELISCMIAGYRRSGTFNAGDNAAHLPLLKGSAT